MLIPWLQAGLPNWSQLVLHFQAWRYPSNGIIGWPLLLCRSWAACGCRQAVHTY